MNPLHANNRVRPIWGLLIGQLYFSFTIYTLIKNRKERMMEHWFYKLGEISDTTEAKHSNVRFPADRKKNYVRYSNLH